MLKEYRTLVPYFKRYGLMYTAGILCLVLTNAGQLLVPQYLRRAVDTISSGFFELGQILNVVLLIVFTALVIGAGRFGWRFFLIGAARRIETKLRHRLYTHLQQLSSTFYNRAKVGDLMARFTNDMNAIRMASGFALVALIDGVFLTGAILIILFSQDVMLTLLVISPLPLVTVFVIVFGKSVGVKFREVQEGFSSLSEHVQESLSGIRVLKTFVKERYFFNRFNQRNEEYCGKQMSLVRIWGLFFPLFTFFSGTTTLLFLIFGGWAVMEGRLSPGGFTAFLAYLEMMIWPMIGAGFTINLIQRGGASLGRINRLLEEEPDIVSPAVPIRRVNGSDILIRNLSYTYSGTTDAVIHDLDLSVTEGCILGILGRTGSGKSTLVRLLPRLLDPPPGTVFIGGMDVRDYDLKVLRSHIGVVPQDTFLFSTTIEENIAIGRKDWQRGEVERAAGISTISRDLEQFPAGLETVVGERGITLSGGQKQRVAISRALFTDPRILILDDSLSSVDTETENTILEGLGDVLRGRTVILISHRVSTLKLADSIIVLDAGRIVQRGTHDELIGEEGFYQEVYNLQQLEERLEV